MLCADSVCRSRREPEQQIIDPLIHALGRRAKVVKEAAAILIEPLGMVLEQEPAVLVDAS
jgi:hypothetical protein